jgi:hypothetical protein
VEDVSELAAQARALGKEAFSERFAGQLFIVKPPSHGVHRKVISEPPLSYQTSQARVTSRDIDAHDVLGSELCVWAIQKKWGNPYKDRISIGRARNCDLVLRAPYLSKLHAHFWRDADGTFRLSDNHSANGTRVNGALLLTGQAQKVTSGDRVAFGGLELIVLGPQELYLLLVD